MNIRFSFFLLASTLATTAFIMVVHDWPASRSQVADSAGTATGREASPSGSSLRLAFNKHQARDRRQESDRDDLSIKRLEGLAERNSAGAIEEAAALPEAQRIRALAAVIRVRAPIDLDEILEMIRKKFGDESRLRALSLAGRALVGNHPETAVALAEEFPSGAARDAYLRDLVGGWVSSSPGEAAAWSRDLPETGGRDTLQSCIAISWAQSSPRDAAFFVADAIRPGQAQEDAALNVALRWAHLDPPAAAGWVRELPESGLRDAMLEGVMSNWSARNPESP